MNPTGPNWQPATDNWQLLLLGGASGAGKSVTAERIAKRHNVSWLQADSIFLATAAVTTAESHPELHLFLELEGPWFQLPMRVLLGRFIETCERVSQALAPVVVHELSSGNRAILEGTWITPAFAASACKDQRVRTVFIDEREQQNVTDAMLSRASAPELTPRRRKLAELSWMHGNWLRSECERLGLPMIAARPWESLADRALAAATP